MYPIEHVKCQKYKKAAEAAFLHGALLLDFNLIFSAELFLGFSHF